MNRVENSKAIGYGAEGVREIASEPFRDSRILLNVTGHTPLLKSVMDFGRGLFVRIAQ